jgi:uncharacterized membrane protein
MTSIAVQAMKQVESTAALDRLAPLYARLGGPVAATRLGDLFRGEGAGHALHPALTDLPIGFWTSAMALDLMGAEQEDAADLLVGLGLLSAVPVVLTGLAEWQRLGQRDARVGSLHALLNSVGTVGFACSLVARRRGRRKSGIALSYLAATAATAAGFLGGHLTVARQVGSRDAAYR